MAETQGREKADMFEMYNQTFKAWTDIYNSWSRSMSGFGPASGSSPSDYWTSMYRRFAAMPRSAPMPSEFLNDLSDAFIKNTGSYTDIFNTWYKEMTGVASKSYELSRKASAGETLKSDEFLDTLKTVYDNISASTLNALKNTPFAGAKAVNQAVKEWLDAIPEDQKRKGSDFLQELSTLNVKVMNTTMSNMKDAGKSVAHLLEKGTIAGNGLQGAIDSYVDILKDTTELLQKSGTLPESGRATGQVTDWARAAIDHLIAHLEMNIKMLKGINTSASEMYQEAEQSLKSQKISDPDQIYRFFRDFSQKAADNLMGNTEFFDSLTRVMGSYTEWAKVTMALCQDMVINRYATSEDLNNLSSKLHREVARVKSSVEKSEKKTTRAPTESKPVS